jgi:histidinol-phosphate aminotransferase
VNTDDAPGVRLRQEIVAVPAYKQGRAAPADGFKLSSNENPFPPLAGVMDAVAGVLGDLNRYPNAGGLDLRERLAERHGVGVGQVHLGNGSVSLIAQLISAAAGAGDEVVYSWRSFEAYPGLVTVAGATSVQVPNRTDAGHDLPAMAAAITDRTRVVIVCTPNNPTGPIVTAAEFEAFMALVPSDLLVLLDEAYYEFATDDASVDGIPLLSRYPNLVVLRTFSKAYGLAGLRIGYGLCAPDLGRKLWTMQLPFGIGITSLVAVAASYDAENQLRQRIRMICSERRYLRMRMRSMGVYSTDGHANFVYLPGCGQPWREVFDGSGVQVRNYADGGTRITVGNRQSTRAVLTAMAPAVR